jgi:hypothetical protein
VCFNSRREMTRLTDGIDFYLAKIPDPKRTFLKVIAF